MISKDLSIKLLAPILLFFIVILSCKNDEASRVEGTLINIDSLVNVKIFRQDFDRVELVNSVKVTHKKPNFTFKLGKLDEPTFFQLHIEGKRNNSLVLLLEPKEKVNINIDLKNFLNYSIIGSEGSLNTKKLLIQIAKTIKTIDSLEFLLKRKATNAEKWGINLELEAALQSQRDFSSKFIWENPMSRASVMALYQRLNDDRFVFDRPEDLQLFKMVASSLLARYPESNYAKGMVRDIKNQEKIISSHKIQQLIQSAESTLPEIALPNPMGDTLRLSSLKGKLILLDFWASYSQDNLLENRELIHLYRRYKPRGFEIYQVSLDVDREPWLAAIESAGLPWINVWDANSNRSLVLGPYNVTKIPANYLIGRDYSIIGKDLFGKDLEKKLKEVL